MKKILALTLFAFLLILPLGAAKLEFCKGATHIEPVDMWVVGDGCHHSNRVQDSYEVYVPSTNIYTVTGVVHRGNPGQCQTNEAFTLTIDGQTGPKISDDADPCAVNVTEEYLGTFNLVAGDTMSYMDTAAQCPPDTNANSVDVTYICLYEQTDGEVPEFGLIGALVAVAAIGGFVVFRRKN